jgi:sigma-B regulation protein RsbU (phosphoserine phosphatase)
MSAEALTILLIEDSPTDRLLVRATLDASRLDRFAVIEEDHLEDGISRAGSEPFDVVLLDLTLPDSRGIETFYRAHAAMPDVPVVVLSGLADEEIAMNAVQHGAQDYLLKSFAMKDLLPRAIRYAVERHRSRQLLEGYAEELRVKNAMLEDELQMAREIQQALLPHHYPEVSDGTRTEGNRFQFSHYYRPATVLSGDFFNILPLSETRAGVLICDVMGHGVRAALIGALARGAISRFMPIAAEPGRFLTSLNAELSTILKQCEMTAFASAFYMVADVAERRLSYSNAGHPSALVLRRDEGRTEWMHAGGHHLPLGLSDAVAYPSDETGIGSHDSVVLFTDGVYEAQNRFDEHYGFERLVGAVNRRIQEPCGALLGDLVEDVQRFAGRDEFADDVCLVGMDLVTSGPGLPDAA